MTRIELDGRKDAHPINGVLNDSFYLLFATFQHFLTFALEVLAKYEVT